MSPPETPHIIRKLGDNEHYSSSRHHLGLYHCVTVSCRYSHPPSSQPDGTSISPAFFAALAAVVRDQPMLRVGITGDDTSSAHFTHIPSIDLRNHVSVTAVPCQSVQEYEDKITQHQQWEHDQRYHDLAVKPPWRVAILRPSSDKADVVEQLKGQEDVFFAFHHSLMDGTSGRRFHEMLLATPAYQGQPVPSEPEYILSYPEPPSSFPEPQEQAIDFTLSLVYTARTLWKAFGPAFLQPSPQPIWNAIPIDLSRPNKTRIKPIDFPPEALSTLLSACRSHSVTLTALLHSLILASFSSRTSPAEAPAFASATPINLRPFTSPSIDPAYASSLRCLVASAKHSFSPQAVSALRAPDADTTALIWQNAQHVKAELATKLNSMPHNDIMGMLKYLTDWAAFWRARDGKPRTESWDLSNIGVLKNPDTQDDDVPRATRMLFSNGAMAAGTPLVANIATVAGAKFTIGFSWPDAVVKDELVDQLAEDLTSYITKYHETGNSFV